MDRVCIGKIVAAFGIKGELKVFPYTRTFEEFKSLKSVYLDDRAYMVEKARLDKNTVLLKLKDVSDRNSAELFKDKLIYALKSEYFLSEDTFFVDDLIGISVYSENDSYLGKLTSIIQNTSQDVYEITKEDGNNFLVPAVKEFVKSIALNDKKMIIHLIDGLID